MTASAPAPAPSPLVDVQGLVKDVPGERGLLGLGRPRAAVRAVDGVSFAIAPGQTLGLVGESGCGKSTVGRTMLRLIEPDRGRVTIDGQDVGALKARALRALRRRMQIVFQDPYGSLNPRMTVRQMLAEPLRSIGSRAGPTPSDASRPFSRRWASIRPSRRATRTSSWAGRRSGVGSARAWSAR